MRHKIEMMIADRERSEREADTGNKNEIENCGGRPIHIGWEKDDVAEDHPFPVSVC
jgi:hypothetical protein